jgi:hypothetical protein
MASPRPKITVVLCEFIDGLQRDERHREVRVGSSLAENFTTRTSLRMSPRGYQLLPAGLRQRPFHDSLSAGQVTDLQHKGVPIMLLIRNLTATV